MEHRNPNGKYASPLIAIGIPSAQVFSILNSYPKLIPTQEMAMDYVLNNQRGPGGSGVSSQVGGSNSAAGTVPPAPGGGGSTAAAGNSDVGRANANAAANARAGGVEGAAGAGQVGPYRGVAPVPLSAADQEAQMQQALQASLTQTSGGGGGGSAQGSGDSELQRALELSKKEARTKSNPYLRKREEGVPVGLRNSGNTCYFNALLQVMFYLRPQLFRAVLEFNPDMVDVVAAQRAEEAAEQARAALAAEQAAIIERSESSESADGDTDGADADATSAIGDMPEDPAAPLPTFEPTARERAAVEFTQHWQRLYASLLLSQRKFLDAKHAVDALFRFSGDTSQSGAQHDIMEFYEHIFSALQTAFESCRHHPRLLEELFMCHTSQETVVVNPDTDERVDVETQHALIKDFQLNVSAGDMYRGLDDFFITEIEGYRIDGTDVRTTAKQTTWIEELPRVLSIQLKRVQYDRSKGDMVKVNSRFDFDQEIFLDRYLLSNREEVMSRRTRLAELDKLRAELSDELGRLSNFQDLGVPLDKAIGATSVLLQEPEKHEELVDRAAIDDAKLEAARSVITALKKRVEERMESLSHDIETTSKQIKNLFSDLNSERYVLLAVSVHDGQFAHRGHYWTFVRDFAKSQWFKYNDAQVLPVGEELVMLESIGGNTTASAYFFVYVRAEDAETVSALPESELINLIPPHAREGVEADNVAFSTELTDWDEQQWKQELESHINTFVSNFEDTVRTLMRVASSYSPHISSFADKAMRLDDLTEDPRLASLISISAALRRNSVVDALTLKRLVEELDIPNPAMRAYVLDAVRSKLIAKYKFCAAGIPVGLTDRYPMALALRMHSQLASSSADDPNNENDEEAPIEMSFTESVRIELEHVQAAFLAFQNDTRLFLHGLRALQAEQFEDAFHLLFSCLSWGGDVKFSRRYETVVYLMLTIYKLFGQVFREIHAPETQGRRRVELLLSLVPLTKKVAFVCLTHPAKRYASHMLGQLRECWVSALELVQEDGSEEELERIQSGLNSLLTDMASSYRLKFDVPETVQVDEDAIPPASLDDRAIFDCHRELSRAVCKKYAQEIDEVALLCVKNEPAPGLAS